jgi:hypothetical protein
MHTRRLPGGRGVTGTEKDDAEGAATAAAVPGGAAGVADALAPAAATHAAHQAKPSSASARAMRTHRTHARAAAALPGCLRETEMCCGHLFFFSGSSMRKSLWHDHRHNDEAAQRSRPRDAERSRAVRPVCHAARARAAALPRTTRQGAAGASARTQMRRSARVRSRPPRRRARR